MLFRSIAIIEKVNIIIPLLIGYKYERKRGEWGDWKKAGEKGEKSDLIESLSRTTQSRKLKPTIQVSCEPKSGQIQKPYIGAAQH